MKGFVETVIGGAIGLIALYVVGKVAYQAGKDVAKAECEHEALRKKNAGNDIKEEGLPEENEETASMAVVEARPAKKLGKVSMLLNGIKLLYRKNSVLGDLMKHPESHKLEAFVEGDGLRINVRKRPLLA